MLAYTLAPEALQDLQNIWEFISADSVTAANKLEDEFFEAFEQLAQRPGLGHTRSDLTKQDVRFWPIHSYLIIYRSRAVLEIVAILHGRRDVAEVIRKR